jgi:hypothetical protein
MVESAAHLVDHVFPEVPVRQFVLTFSFPLRFLLAAQPKALTDVLAGSTLNLNIHLHMLFLVGAYSFSDRGASFHRARRPTNGELTALLDTLSQRIVRLLERRGMLIADPGLDFETGSSLDQRQAASIQYLIAIGPHAGRKALTLYSVPPEQEVPDISMLARLYRFSLHAATVGEAHQRDRLERLCRYITRPPSTMKNWPHPLRACSIWQRW